MEKRSSNFGTLMKGLLIGAAVFGTVALFTAPHSGAETRQIIRDKGEQLREKTLESIENVRGQVDTVISDMRGRADNLAERITPVEVSQQHDLS